MLPLGDDEGNNKLMKTARLKNFRHSRIEEIINLLGRRPHNAKEYSKIYRYIFGDMAGENQRTLKLMRRRHMNHTGPASIKRQYCLFCEKEKTFKYIPVKEVR